MYILMPKVFPFAMTFSNILNFFSNKKQEMASLIGNFDEPTAIFLY